MSGPYWWINLFEAALWIGSGLLVCGIALARRTLTPAALVLAAALVAFGLSDVVETHTGAWWRPWWLLAWKALCVLVLLALALPYRRSISS